MKKDRLLSADLPRHTEGMKVKMPLPGVGRSWQPDHTVSDVISNCQSSIHASPCSNQSHCAPGLVGTTASDYCPKAAYERTLNRRERSIPAREIGTTRRQTPASDSKECCKFVSHPQMQTLALPLFPLFSALQELALSTLLFRVPSLPSLTTYNTTHLDPLKKPRDSSTHDAEKSVWFDIGDEAEALYRQCGRAGLLHPERTCGMTASPSGRETRYAESGYAI